MTALKSLLFFILAPGMVAGYIPLALLRSGPQIQTGFLSYLAFPLWLIGGAILIWCFWDFLVKGRGTPAPIDPPKELVVAGLYQLCPQPDVFWCASCHHRSFSVVWILVFAGLCCGCLYRFQYLRQPLTKSQTSKRRFGATYEDYLKRVPRWIPRIR